MDIGRRTQNDARASNGPQQIIQIRFRRIGALGARLGTKILDNHFLHMAVTRMAFCNGAQRFQPFGKGFTNANQNAGGEGNPRLSRRTQHLKPQSRVLIRAAVMHAARLAQALTCAFQHHALAGSHIAQGAEFRCIQHARIGMGQ